MHLPPPRIAKRLKTEEADRKEKEERKERRYDGLEKDKHSRFVGNKTNKEDIRKAVKTIKT